MLEEKPGETFSALVVDKVDIAPGRAGDAPAGVRDKVTACLRQLTLDDLPRGELLIRNSFSSLNYKDALAAQGNRAVVRHFPHVPGIDVMGHVEQDSSGTFEQGATVLVTGHDLGVKQWGGFAQYTRVPVSWAQRLPSPLTEKQAMIFGTAGFTAALSVQALLDQQVRPNQGEVLVTGASGGVGSLAVRLLALEGFQVVAATGKANAHTMLTQGGATRIISRDDLAGQQGKPLLSAQWAGAIDTVGGSTLGSLLRSIIPGGSVAACGNAGGFELNTTVYPFILRGIKLLGIDSVWQSMTVRNALWAKMSGPWLPGDLESLATEIDLAEVPAYAQNMLAGQSQGRTVVCVG